MAWNGERDGCTGRRTGMRPASVLPRSLLALVATVVLGCGQGVGSPPPATPPVPSASVPAAPSASASGPPTVSLPASSPTAEVLQVGAWRRLSPLPVPRSEMPGAVLGRRLYVAGGFFRR